MAGRVDLAAGPDPGSDPRLSVVGPTAWAAVAAAVLVSSCGVADVADDVAAPSVEADRRPARGGGVEVARVIDGDSVELLVDGETVEARLVGINAPELFTLDDRRSCPGHTARDELASLLDAASNASGAVTVVEHGTDRFARLLVELLVDGRSINAALVEAGWALGLWSADDPALVELMREAADGERGWWGPACGPAETGLTIGETRVDAPGDDRENLAEEWITIVNASVVDVDLGGWTVRDETTSNRFLLDGVVLAPRGELRVRTGPDPASGSSGLRGADRSPGSDLDLYLGERFPVWSNGGETVLLLDPDGRIAARDFVEGR